MSLLLFLSTASATALLLFLFFNKIRLGWIGVITASVTLFTVGLGTHRSCADGWISPSIGKQGACSHHGGVIVNLNDFGWIMLILSIAFLVIAAFWGKRRFLR
uniref:Uncharacterized protein n=1 Tax=Candidatus Kentrum sp. FW TaxID=2126338 RepID=A0A450U2Z0_9GAMM|nr:MAG: hypothetical protein BECKFW1821C_GA0114237_112510 [Candidatus Kentron sp. FW]